MFVCPSATASVIVLSVLSPGLALSSTRQVSAEVDALGLLQTAWSVKSAEEAPAVQAPPDPSCRCTQPLDDCWPPVSAWDSLNASVGGRLAAAATAGGPVDACADPEAPPGACTHQLNNVEESEYWAQQFPNGALSNGWGGTAESPGWQRAIGAYLIAAESAADIQAGVSFAAEHNLRLAVRGAGHDYLGRNTAEGALTIWTMHMQGISWGPDDTVTVEAGVRNGEVKDEAQIRGRYWHGGGCPSVGAAGGLPLAGGYGDFSRTYGSLADNMVSASVVLADGSLVVADEDSNPDLFWALRGGGGGTFGVVTSLTYRTWPAVTLAGSASATIDCITPSRRNQFIETVVVFLRDRLLPGSNWGGVLHLRGMGVELVLKYNGITGHEALAVMDEFVESRTRGCVVSGRSVEDVPQMLAQDGSSVAQVHPFIDEVYLPNTGDAYVDSQHTLEFLRTERSAYWVGAVSRYALRSDLEDAALMVSKLQNITALFPYVLLDFKKSQGLDAMGSVGQNTSTHPGIPASATLVTAAFPVTGYHPSLPDTHETLPPWLSNVRQLATPSCMMGSMVTPIEGDGSRIASIRPLCNDYTTYCPRSDINSWSIEGVQACAAAARALMESWSAFFVNHAMPVIHDTFPTFTYSNAASYHDPHWQEANWGSNYPGLLAVKHDVDPEGLFTCHHCVGSEDWSGDGNCRA